MPRQALKQRVCGAMSRECLRMRHGSRRRVCRDRNSSQKRSDVCFCIVSCFFVNYSDMISQTNTAAAGMALTWQMQDAASHTRYIEGQYDRNKEPNECNISRQKEEESIDTSIDLPLRPCAWDRSALNQCESLKIHRLRLTLAFLVSCMPSGRLITCFVSFSFILATIILCSQACIGLSIV